MTESEKTSGGDLPVVAQNLQSLLARTALSQADVSRRTGIPRDAFGRYLHGINKPPAKKVALIASVFGCTPHDIDPDLPEGDIASDLGPIELKSYTAGAPLSGDPGKLRLEISADLPTEQVVEILRILSSGKQKDN